MDMGFIILAGGKSRRMGENKAFLKLGKATFLDIIIKKAKDFAFPQIIIVTNEAEKYSGLDLDVEVVEDIYPDMGPLAGIYTGLVHTKYKINMVMPCDTPFVSKEFISELIKYKNKGNIIVPKYQEHLEPLIALYSKECINPIKILLDKNEKKVLKLFDLVETFYIDFKSNKYDFLNINTPNDFKKACDILREK